MRSGGMGSCGPDPVQGLVHVLGEIQERLTGRDGEVPGSIRTTGAPQLFAVAEPTTWFVLHAAQLIAERELGELWWSCPRFRQW